MSHMNSNKHIAEEYMLRIWGKKDLTAINDFFHPKVVVHSLLGTFQGPEPLRKIVEAWLTGFPDLHVKNTSVLCQDDRVVVQWDAKGTHKGEFKGIKATGKSITYSGVTIYRIANNKIVEYWVYLDMQHVLQQISKQYI